MPTGCLGRLLGKGARGTWLISFLQLTLSCLPQDQLLAARQPPKQVSSPSAWHCPPTQPSGALGLSSNATFQKSLPGSFFKARSCSVLFCLFFLPSTCSHQILHDVFTGLSFSWPGM